MKKKRPEKGADKSPEAQFLALHDRQRLRADKQALWDYTAEVVGRYAAGETVWRTSIAEGPRRYTLFSAYELVGRIEQDDSGGYITRVPLYKSPEVAIGHVSLMSAVNHLETIAKGQEDEPPVEGTDGSLALLT